MRSSWRCAGIAFLGLVAACAETPPPASPAVVALVAAEPKAPAAPDLSPVEEPRGLLVVARWKSPLTAVDEALRLLGVPVSLETLLSTTEARDVATLVAPDASADLVISLDPTSTDDEPRVLLALSLPLASFDEARKVAEKEGALLAIHPGVLRLAGKHGDKAACDLAMATGDAPARLVCGGGERDLEALRGWLVRGLPRTPPATHELTASVRFKPLKDRYLPLLRTRSAALGEEARAALARQGVREPDLLAAPEIALDEGMKLLADLDGLELRSAITRGPSQVVAGGSVRFGAQTSWMTRALTDVNDKAGPAPPMFWRVPRDAYSATWGRSSDPRLFDGLRGVLHKAVAEGLARAPLSPADKEVIEAFADGAPRLSGNWVTANGFLPGAKRPAAKAHRTPAEALADARALAVSALGWTLIGVDAPAADYVTWAKQGLDVYTHGVRFVRETLTAAKGTPPKDLELLGFIPRVTTTTSPPGWPKGTVAFDVLLTYDSDVAAALLDLKTHASPRGVAPKKKAPAAKGSLTLRLAIVPEGERTWIGFAADVDGLKQRMSAVLSGAPPEGTLARREGLEGLREPGQIWGGFFSVGELLQAVVEGVEKEKPEHAAGARAALATLPNKGRTPILLVGTGTAGRAPSSTAELRVQQGSLADLAAMVSFLASPVGQKLFKTLDAAAPVGL
jgi:hypothetical protein